MEIDYNAVVTSIITRTTRFYCVTISMYCNVPWPVIRRKERCWKKGPQFSRNADPMNFRRRARRGRASPFRRRCERKTRWLVWRRKKKTASWPCDESWRCLAWNERARERKGGRPLGRWTNDSSCRLGKNNSFPQWRTAHLRAQRERTPHHLAPTQWLANWVLSPLLHSPLRTCIRIM